MNRKVRSHQNLDVWKKSIALVKDIYQLTSIFPKEEIYGLTNQMRRAAVSVPSNISEGAARSGKKEFLKYLYIARGSLSELDTQVEIAKEIGYLGDADKIHTQIDSIFALLGGLINSVKNRSK